MQKMTAVIRIEKFDDVRAVLEKRGYPGLPSGGSKTTESKGVSGSSSGDASIR